MMGITRAKVLDEKGASFQIGGTFEVENSWHDNLDDAITYAANTNVSGSINDDVNIVINAGVILNMTGDTAFLADANGDGTGAFSMDSTATIDGNNYDLSITASGDSTIGILTDVDILTLGTSTPAHTPIFSSATTVDDIDVNTFKTNNGATFTKTVGTGADANNARLIYDVTQLQGMSDNLGYYYKLANNIDASATEDWNGGAGFSAVGDGFTNFTGDLDGNDFTISNLAISRSGTSRIGLFGTTNGSNISNDEYSD